jgi:hypothetical protein
VSVSPTGHYTARKQLYRQSVQVHYFLHPLYENEVPVLETRHCGSEESFLVRLIDNTVLMLPFWMTDPEFCQRCKVQEKPGCSLEALQELRVLLDGLAF